ncbi:MAG: protease modulator HflC [Gammaproteobacteria bacterium]|nr:protease modulator HflC [Gammaproteobacteria bacterium]NNC98293.1 protease modulator HflC [Gammaproteobacteria bacterium]NNM13605.1 protease modulator HflC [Gammaproteobacteria bacterium]
MNKLQSYLIPLFFLGLLLSQCFFAVDETEKVVKLRFGKIVEANYEPGLAFKYPFIENLRRFDDRILTIDNAADRFLTNEKKNLIVDFFVKWRIKDVSQFYIATNGNENTGSNRLLDIIKDGLRGEFAKLTVQEAVSADRTEIMQEMFARATITANELGVEVIDIRIKRLDLPDEVIGDAFERMRQERKRVATKLRAEGEEEAEKIRASAERERTVILAEAYRDAEIIRGEGDAKATEIYAKAFEKNREFYNFYRSLEAYRKAIGNGNDIMVLSPDSEFFEYLGDSIEN